MFLTFHRRINFSQKTLRPKNLFFAEEMPTEETKIFLGKIYLFEKKKNLVFQKYMFNWTEMCEFFNFNRKELVKLPCRTYF